MYRPVLPEIGRYDWYEAGIFSSTKQGGRTYWIAGQYGIFRPYRPVQYGIDNLGLDRILRSEVYVNEADG